MKIIAFLFFSLFAAFSVIFEGWNTAYNWYVVGDRDYGMLDKQPPQQTQYEPKTPRRALLDKPFTITVDRS